MSVKALEAAKARVQGRVLVGWGELEEGFAAACDPALGLDRLVCLRDVVAFIGPHFMGAHVNAGVVAAAISQEFAPACPKCHGEGEYEVNPGNDPQEAVPARCDECEGSGVAS